MAELVVFHETGHKEQVIVIIIGWFSAAQQPSLLWFLLLHVAEPVCY